MTNLRNGEITADSLRAFPAELDVIDMQIVQLLQRDGRMSNTKMARHIGVTETTIRKRLSAIMEDGYLDIVAVPTPKLAGLRLSAILGVSVDLRSISLVAEVLAKLPEVRYCGVSTGRYDIVLEAFFSDHKDLMRFIVDTLGSQEGITQVESTLILDVKKFSYEWQILDETHL